MARRTNKGRPQRPNATGRNDKSARFLMLPHRVVESGAYASLDLAARALLQELVHIYNGSNNGSLWLSVRDATARLGQSDCHVAVRAFEELRDRGFIALAKDSHFRTKAADTSRARCWRLTWHAWPECPVKTKRPPTNDWERWTMPRQDTPANKRANRRADQRLRALDKYRKDAAAGKMPVVDSTTMGLIAPQIGGAPVVDFTTASSRTNGNAPFSIVRDSTTHIDDTMGRGGSGWWSSDAEAQIRGQILLLSIVAQNRPGKLARAA